MLLFAFHIVAVGILVVVVWAIAYRQGQLAGARRLQRRLEREGRLLAEDAAVPGAGPGA